MNVLAVRTNPEDETLVPLTPPEKLPDSSRQLVSLDPGLLPATIPGQGNGIGSGLGSEIGNGLGSGLGHGRGSTWIHSAQGDEQLKVAVNFLDVKDYTPPDYPEEARSRGISGDVVLAVTIDREGAPVKWSVVEGQPSLVAATLKAFPKWHFIAPVYKGEKVGASFEVRVRFTLM
jgi:TonB family protein